MNFRKQPRKHLKIPKSLWFTKTIDLSMTWCQSFSAGWSGWLLMWVEKAVFYTSILPCAIIYNTTAKQQVSLIFMKQRKLALWLHKHTMLSPLLFHILNDFPGLILLWEWFIYFWCHLPHIFYLIDKQHLSNKLLWVGNTQALLSAGN